MVRFFNLMCFILAMGFALPAYANEYFETKISPEEQAVFAFFRAADTPPDYDFWITSKHEFRTLPEKKQQDFLIKEMLRLGHGYGVYDLNTDLLELKVNVVSRYMPGKDGKASYITFRFFNSEEGTTPTFNYSFGSGFISMIISRLDFFRNIKLTPEKDTALREKIPYEGDEFDTTVEMHVRVSKADYNNSIEEEGIKQWIMMGDIAYIKCEVDSQYTHQNYILWDYVAPWHEEAFRIKNMPEEEKYPHPYDLFKD